MVTLNIRQVRASIGHLDKLVEKEGEILVIRHGEPIVRIVSIRTKQKRPSHTELRNSIPIQKVPSTNWIRQERDAR